jgi:hypothetical protein
MLSEPWRAMQKPTPELKPLSRAWQTVLGPTKGFVPRAARTADGRSGTRATIQNPDAPDGGEWHDPYASAGFRVHVPIGVAYLSRAATAA